MLVPNRFLDLIKDGERPRRVEEFDVWLGTHRREWGVSAEVILLRLMEVGRLTRDQYDGYKAWTLSLASGSEEGGNRKYRHREPTHIFGDKYVRTVLDSLEARNITLSRASTYLDSLKIKDLRQLERYYAGV